MILKILQVSVLIVLFSLVPFSIGLTWEIDKRSELQSSLYYRKVPQKGFSSQNESSDFFFRGSEQWRGIKGSWLWEVRPEIYGFSGHSKSDLEASKSDPYYLSIKSTDRLFQLRTKLSLKDEWYLEVEKINLSYSQDEMELSIGRKPVSLGILKIFPVWNKFSKPLPIAMGPATILSADNFLFRTQKENISYFYNSISESKGHENIHFAGLTFYNNEIELHALLGSWWNQKTIGLAAAKDLIGATWRFEGLGYEAESYDSNLTLKKSVQNQVGVGVEYAFSDKISTIAELLFQSGGANNKDKYNDLQDNHFRILKAQNYNYLQVQYKLSALLNISLATLNNGIDGSRYDIFKLQYSYSDNSDLLAEVNLPTGTKNSEFSPRAINLSNGFYLGAPTQISVGLKQVF